MSDIILMITISLSIGYATAGPKGEPGLPGRDGM